MVTPEILLTRHDAGVAELTVTLLEDEGQARELRGRWVGPYSVAAETLPQAYPLQALPPQDGLLRAKALITEPCFWTPARPLTYQLILELHGGARPITLRCHHGLRQLVLHPHRGFLLEGQPLTLAGLAAKEVAPEELFELRSLGLTALLIPLTESALPLWEAATRAGLLILGQVDPEQEAALWLAQEHLTWATSTLGWVLPQSATTHPQHWHNAMSLLHGRRKDCFIGLQIEQLPLTTLPGHIDFLLGDAAALAATAGSAIPHLLLTRHAGTVAEVNPANYLGYFTRQRPEPAGARS